MSRVTTLLAPITQRSPMVTPLVTTTLAPHQTLSPTRVGPLAREALPGHGPVRVVEAVGAVRDEAAVGEHAVVADLDQLDRGDHHADVEKRARADPDAGAGPARSATRAARAGCARRPRAGPRANASSTLPCTGQRAKARRRANSRWMRARFQGSALRSYQRHFCHHRRAFATRDRISGFSAKRPMKEGMDPLSDLPGSRRVRRAARARGAASRAHERDRSRSPCSTSTGLAR